MLASFLDNKSLHVFCFSWRLTARCQQTLFGIGARPIAKTCKIIRVRPLVADVAGVVHKRIAEKIRRLRGDDWRGPLARSLLLVVEIDLELGQRRGRVRRRWWARSNNQAFSVTPAAMAMSSAFVSSRTECLKPGGAYRSDPAADLGWISFVHVEEMAHRRLHGRHAGVIEFHSNGTVKDLE